VRRPYTIVVFSFLIAIFGALAALRTPTEVCALRTTRNRPMVLWSTAAWSVSLTRLATQRLQVRCLRDRQDVYS
jgi:hypothetical protein